MWQLQDAMVVVVEEAVVYFLELVPGEGLVCVLFYVVFMAVVGRRIAEEALFWRYITSLLLNLSLE
jgi:hypothetical protein